ncbi:hypothetical protein ACFFHF_12420 [Robertmurraya beringensis]|uniref:SAF domain-containing protein n=1 Tax=Robertmurraya beringensis TaxID=641660 RepID=A0ABV6KSS4_9BACI
MKPAVKIGSGIFLSLATIGLIFTYDFYIKERIDSEEVVVVKPGEEIKKSERITKDKLIIERRAKDTLLKDVVFADDLKDIIGRDAKQDLIGNSMVSTKMIDYDLMVPDAAEGEAIRPITGDMIYAQPGSLRRKDIIDIYLVNPDGTASFMQSGPSVVTSETPATEEGTETSTEPSTETANHSTSTEGKQMLDTEPFLKNVRVAYVKDSGNKEVVAAEGGVKDDSRLNATSQISDIELILNEEDFTRLMTEVLSKGARLYITYQ